MISLVPCQFVCVCFGKFGGERRTGARNGLCEVKASNLMNPTTCRITLLPGLDFLSLSLVLCLFCLQLWRGWRLRLRISLAKSGTISYLLTWYFYILYLGMRSWSIFLVKYVSTPFSLLHGAVVGSEWVNEPVWVLNSGGSCWSQQKQHHHHHQCFHWEKGSSSTTTHNILLTFSRSLSPDLIFLDSWSTSCTTTTANHLPFSSPGTSTSHVVRARVVRTHNQNQNRMTLFLFITRAGDTG